MDSNLQERTCDSQCYYLKSLTTKRVLMACLTSIIKFDRQIQNITEKLIIPESALTYIRKMLHQHEDTDNGYDNVATMPSAHAQLDKQMNRCMDKNKTDTCVSETVSEQ